MNAKNSRTSAMLSLILLAMVGGIVEAQEPTPVLGQTDPDVWVRRFKETRSPLWSPWDALNGCLTESPDARRVVDRFLGEAFDYDLTVLVGGAVAHGISSCPEGSSDLQEWYQGQLLRWAAEGRVDQLFRSIHRNHIRLDETFIRQLIFTPSLARLSVDALLRSIVVMQYEGATTIYLEAVRDGRLEFKSKLAVSSMLEDRLGAEGLLRRLTDAVRRDPSLAGDGTSIGWASSLARPEKGSPAAPAAREFLREVWRAEERRPGTVSKGWMDEIRRAGVIRGG